MSTPFQNRLVGTIIVAAAIIIFLPDILDGKKKSRQNDFEAIPKAPAFTGKMVEKPFPHDKLIAKKPVEVVNEDAIDDQLAFTENQRNIASTPNKPIKDKTNKIKVTPAKKSSAIVESNKNNQQSAIKKPALGAEPEKAVNQEAWVIQLGSFKNKKNVEELLIKLKKNGYVAFTKPIKTKKGSLTKVFIGPELIKSSLEKKLPALKNLTHVQGKLARFYPTK